MYPLWVYAGLVTEKVVEMLTNTHRFVVVDRTSRDKVVDELELQKSEAFLDSHNLAEQGAAVAAEQLVTGHIVKIPVYRMKNSDGSTRGYKASVAFQLKDTFTIESVEMLDGKPYPSELGKAKVTKLSGESFAECSVSRKVIIAIENSKASNNLVR